MSIILDTLSVSQRNLTSFEAAQVLPAPDSPVIIIDWEIRFLFSNTLVPKRVDNSYIIKMDICDQQNMVEWAQISLTYLINI